MVPTASIALASVGGHIMLSLFVLIGVAMFVWNRRLSNAITAQQRAFLEELGVARLERLHPKLERQRWFVPAVRIYMIFFALLWIETCVAGLILSQ